MDQAAQLIRDLAPVAAVLCALVVMWVQVALTGGRRPPVRAQHRPSAPPAMPGRAGRLPAQRGRDDLMPR